MGDYMMKIKAYKESEIEMRKVCKSFQKSSEMWEHHLFKMTQSVDSPDVVCSFLWSFTQPKWIGTCKKLSRR